MENKRLTELTETLNKYLTESGWDKKMTCSELISDKILFDKVTEAVIGLICKIGIDENLIPNIDGIILDGCLETLNELREECFENE